MTWSSCYINFSMSQSQRPEKCSRQFTPPTSPLSFPHCNDQATLTTRNHQVQKIPCIVSLYEYTLSASFVATVTAITGEGNFYLRFKYFWRPTRVGRRWSVVLLYLKNQYNFWKAVGRGRIFWGLSLMWYLPRQL